MSFRFPLATFIQNGLSLLFLPSEIATLSYFSFQTVTPCSSKSIKSQEKYGTAFTEVLVNIKMQYLTPVSQKEELTTLRSSNESLS